VDGDVRVAQLYGAIGRFLYLHYTLHSLQFKLYISIPDDDAPRCGSPFMVHPIRFARPPSSDLEFRVQLPVIIASQLLDPYRYLQGNT
jgi:hypothetical protein